MTISFSTSSWPNLSPAATTRPAADETKQGGASSPLSSSVETEFLKFARMTPEERVQKAILDKLGMTEEEFNRLDAKAKSEVMAKVRDEILRQMEEKAELRTGALADLTV